MKRIIIALLSVGIMFMASATGVAGGQNIPFQPEDRPYNSPDPVSGVNYTGNTPYPGDRSGAAFDTSSQEKPVPIILIHGFLSERSTFSSLTDRLDAENIPDYYYFEYTDYIDKSPANISAGLKTYLLQEGITDRCDIIAHSYGATVSRWYLEEDGGADIVRQWIGVCPAHHGSAYADAQMTYPLLNLAVNTGLYVLGFWDSVTPYLTTENDVVRILKESEERGINNGVKYRVIAGINPGLRKDGMLWSLFNGFTQTKRDTVYSWTNLGDGIVSLDQALMKDQDYDLFPYTHAALGTDARAVLDADEVLDTILYYYLNPSVPSKNPDLRQYYDEEIMSGDETDFPQLAPVLMKNRDLPGRVYREEPAP